MSRCTMFERCICCMPSRSWYMKYWQWCSVRNWDERNSLCISVSKCSKTKNISFITGACCFPVMERLWRWICVEPKTTSSNWMIWGCSWSWASSLISRYKAFSSPVECEGYRTFLIATGLFPFLVKEKERKEKISFNWLNHNRSTLTSSQDPQILPQKHLILHWLVADETQYRKLTFSHHTEDLISSTDDHTLLLRRKHNIIQPIHRVQVR